MTRHVMVVFLIGAALASGGCVREIAHDTVVRNLNPWTYEQVEKQWKPIPSGHGRVVVYFKKGMAGAMSFPIKINNQTIHPYGDTLVKSGLLYRNFIFTDLPLGTHTFSRKSGLIAILATWKPYEFTLSDQQILYIELTSNFFVAAPLPNFLSRDEAINALGDVVYMAGRVY